MAFQVVEGDITSFVADALVISANPRPVVGNGTDRKIYKEAGKDRLLHDRKRIGKISPGEARITESHKLHRKGIKYLVHVVAPKWKGGDFSETDILRKCYANAIEAAREKGCKSIAFPLLATSAMRFPRDIALDIAKEVCDKYANETGMDIYLVHYSKRKHQERQGKEFEILWKKIQQYIDRLSGSAVQKREDRREDDPITFEEFLDDLMRKNGIKTYKEISERGQVDLPRISKVKKKSAAARDTLWRIAIGVKANWDDTKKYLNYVERMQKTWVLRVILRDNGGKLLS